MILISNDFWHKRKINNFDPYNVFLFIAKYTPATQHCFCAPGSHIIMISEDHVTRNDAENTALITEEIN